MTDEEPAEPAPPPPVRPRRRWLKRALVGLVAAALGVSLALHLPPVQRWLVSVALRGLVARQSLDLTWRDVRFNLIARTASIDGLRLGELGAPTPLVTADHVAVSFPFGLFRGRLDGLDVTLERGVVSLVREGGRWTTMPAAWTRSTPGAPPRSLPAFAALRLRDVAVIYDDRDTHFKTETRGLRVELLPTGPEPGDLAGELSPGSITDVHWEPRATRLTLSGGRARFSPGGAGVEQLRLDAPEGRIHSDVRFAFKGTDRFALTTRAELKADQLAGWVSALETARGDLLVDIAMPAAKGAPAFADVVVTSADLFWRGVTAQAFRASGALETGAITLTHAELSVGRGRIEGDARLVWTATGDNHANLRGRDIDVAATLRALVPGTPAVARFTPGGLVSGAFTGTWPTWHAAALNGRLDTTWRGRPLEGPERYGVTGGVDVRFARGPWVIELDTQLDGGVGVAGSWTLASSPAEFARWPMKGTLQISGATPGLLTTGLRLFDIDSPADLSTASGEVAGSVTLEGTLGDPIATTALDGAIAWPDQPAIAVNANAVVTASDVRLTSFEATSGPSRADASLTIDLDRETIEGTFRATAVPVEAWLRRFAIEAPVTGVVDGQGTLSGPLSAVVVDGDVTGGPVVVAGQGFERVSGHVKYDGDQVQATGVSLGRGEGQITGRLTWTTEGGALDGVFDMAALTFETTVPGIVNVEGVTEGRLGAVVGGHATLSGTVDEPRVDLTLDTSDVTLDARRFGPVTITARTESAALTRITATAVQLGATLAGTVDLAEPRAFDLTARVDTADSMLALDTRGVAIDVGAMALEAHATGTLSGPVVDTAELAITRLEGAVLKEAAQLLPFKVEPGARVRYQRESAPAAGTPARQLFTVENLAVSTGSTRLAAAGILGSTDDTLKVTGAGRLEDFRPLMVAMAAGTDAFVVEGPMRLEAALSGSVEQPSVKGNFDLDGARVGDGIHPPFEEVWVRLALEGEQLRLDLVEGRWQGAHLAVSGAVPTWFLRLPGSARTSQRAAISGHVDDVTLRVLEPFVEPDSLKATTFDAKASFALTAAEPSLDAVTGDLRLDQAVLRSRERGIVQRSPAQVHLERGVVTLAPWTVGAPWSTRTALTLGGTATLPTADRPAAVDVRLNGSMDLQAPGLLLGGFRPSGLAAIDLRVQGALPKPAIEGVLAVSDAELLIREPRLVLDDLNGTVRFTRERVTLERLTGSINGGTLEGGGSMSPPWRGKPDGALTLRTRGMLLEIPKGLRSAVDTDLTLAERTDGRFGLGGTITVADAAYRESLVVTGGLMSLITPRDQEVVIVDSEASGVEWLTMDLRVRADDSIAVDTPYGRFNVGTNLRVQGTPARPRLSGTATVAPGGELFVGGHTYQIETAVVEFRGQLGVRPNVRFNARTTVSGYDITLDIQTRSGVTETSLQSDPPLPEDDIASLLLSGQRRGGADAAEAVTEQLGAALSGEIVSVVGRAIGFDSVRVEQGNPGDVMFDSSIISADTNPAQRLTFSKRVFPDLEVIVSQSLRESGDITWIVSWQPISGVELRFVQLDDEDKSYEIRHDISFGGGVKRSRKPQKRRELVREVQFSTTGEVPEGTLRPLLKVTEGKRFDFYDWQGDRDRLLKWLLENGFYEARLVARRDPPTPPPLGQTAESHVSLTYALESGPKTRLVVDGVTVPDRVREQLIEGWVNVPIDSLLAEEFATILRPWLASQAYLQPEIALAIDRPGGVKTVTLKVATGPKSTERIVVYSGNEGLSRSDLDKAIDTAGIRDRMWVQSSDARTVVLNTYRQQGYLSAQVTVGEPRYEGVRAELPIRIDEGPRFRAGTVRVDGAGEIDGVDTQPPVAEGTVLTDRLVADAVRTLQGNFRRAGYRGTQVTAESTTRPDGGTVDLVFTVLVGQRARLGEIRVAGADNAPQSLIERTLDFDPGEALSTDRISRGRDRLYDTGLFRTVSVETEASRNPDGTANTSVLDANVTLEELPQYRLRYGFQLYDPSSPLFEPRWGSVDPGVVFDLTRRGLFGRGITGGVGARLNPSQQTVSGYLSSRTFFGLNAQTNVVVASEFEKTASAGVVLESLTKSITFDQRVRYRRLLQIGYGYSFEKRAVDLLVPLPGVPVPVPVRIPFDIGRLQASVVLDRRDNVVDTRQGPFHSSSFEVGPEQLGSTLWFRKYLGQQFYFVPVKKITLGVAARFEAAGGPGRGLITTERLRVGGSNTVRGYEDDTLSLATISSAKPGTTNILVMNQETRFPLSSRLQGAFFWDHAHIYGETGDFPGLRIRDSVGGGIRVLLPFIILRVDYGYPLRRDERNDKGRWYFAIGQAF